MVKSDSHIDVLFRDGLKNMEMLPPASVWEDIVPHIQKSNTKGFLFRIAAGIAVLTSLGMLAHFFATGSFSSLQNQVATLEQDVPQAVSNASLLASNENPAVNIENIKKDIITPFISVQQLIPSERIDKRTTTSTLLKAKNVPVTLIGSRNDVLHDSSPRRVVAFESAPVFISTDQLSDFNIITKEINSDRWKVGAVVSPTYLSTNLKTANAAIGQLNNIESAVISYSGGVSLSYEMSKRVSIQTGIYYSSLGRQVSGIDSYTGFDQFASSKSGKIFGVETSTGQISSTNSNVYLADASAGRINSLYSSDNFDPVKANLSPLGNELRQNFEYLEIPFVIRYKLIDKRLDFNILGGMSYNILVGNQTYAMGEGEKVLIGSTEGLDNLLLSSSIGMSMGYKLNERFSLNVEPQFRYYLSTDGGISSDNPYTFGVFSGLYYRF